MTNEIVIKEKQYLTLFNLSIIIKGINAIIDIIGGLIIWFTSKVILVNFILDLLQNELSDNPDDYIGNFIVNSAAELSVSSQYFVGGYLLAHGVVKIFLLICLFKKKLWAYPLSIIVFSLLVFYEMYVFYFNGSLWTLSVIFFDIILILLTGHEYGVLKKRLKNK